MKFIVELTDLEYRSLLSDAKDYEESLEIEDFDPQDYSGGNFDDCYEMGVTNGLNEASYNIVRMLGKPVEDV